MSLYERCLSCNASEITLDELLKGLFQKDSFGNTGIEVKLNICDADNVSAVACDLNDPTLADLLKQAMVIDECDKCSLKLFIDTSALTAFLDDYFSERFPQ
jgi:hypothetical protein